MDIFYALAIPTRRTILEMLAVHGKLSASEIGKNFSMSAPAISQHLKVLMNVGLLNVEKRAQRRIYGINVQKVSEVQAWATNTMQLWEQRLDALDHVLKESNT